MSQKKETTTLILALLITVGLIGIGYWFFAGKSGVDLGSLLSGEDPQSGPSESNPILAPPNRPDVATFADLKNVPSGVFAYGGSTTWAPIRGVVDPAIQTVWPQFQLRYQNPSAGTAGSSTGIRMVLQNEIAFAQSSRPVKESEQAQAQQLGFQLKSIPVAFEGIAIAVHPDLNVSGLTLSQLKDIYTGRIANWSQVGGPNRSITPYSRPLNSGGTVDFFVENVLQTLSFGSNVKFVPTTTAALRQLAADTGGVYYASAPEVVPQCTVKSLAIGSSGGAYIPPYQQPSVPLEQCPNQRNQLNSEAFQSGQYPITRQLFVVVKQNGQIEQQSGEAYADLLLSRQGQDLIAKAGFVKIQ